MHDEDPFPGDAAIVEALAGRTVVLSRVATAGRVVGPVLRPVFQSRQGTGPVNADACPTRSPPRLFGLDPEDRVPALPSRHLFTLHVDLPPEGGSGRTPSETRRIFDIAGGRIEGRVNGTLMPSRGHWALHGAEGCLRLDIRAAAELDDDALLLVGCQGRIGFPPGVLPPTRRMAAKLGPSRCHHRLAVLFETASRRHGWLNRILAVAVGRFTTAGAAYEAYEIL